MNEKAIKKLSDEELRALIEENEKKVIESLSDEDMCKHTILRDEEFRRIIKKWAVETMKIIDEEEKMANHKKLEKYLNVDIKTLPDNILSGIIDSEDLNEKYSKDENCLLIRAFGEIKKRKVSKLRGGIHRELDEMDKQGLFNE